MGILFQNGSFFLKMDMLVSGVDIWLQVVYDESLAAFR